MAHALPNKQHFTAYEELKKWVSEWFASKSAKFYWEGIHKLPERWDKSDGHYFE